MISLFDDEQIIRAYLKDAENIAAYETDRATAERMIKRKNADYVPTLSFDELKRIEAEIIQLP